MSRISDIIENYIRELITQTNGPIEIQRNKIADHFDCAPSQINYVLTTRFTTDRGYYIESRRGGGGSIRITRMEMDKHDYLSKILNQKIGESVNKEGAFEFIEILYKQGLIDGRSMIMIKAAVDDSTLSMIEKSDRDKLRANILKAVVVAALA